MASVNLYLNFTDTCEAAFTFYKSVFGGEFEGEGIQRFGEMPPPEGAPPLADEVKNLVLHVGLKIMGDFLLMGSDAPKAMGYEVTMGTNMYINLNADSRAELRTLFTALSEGGKVEQELQEMFWGDFFGSCIDKFGIKWMFATTAKM